MPKRYFVPLVYVDVHPKKNAEHPTIEMTTRTATCPTYMVPLFKAKWGTQAKVEVRPLLSELNPYWEVTAKDGVAAVDAEIARLRRFFNTTKRNVFAEVYTEYQFGQVFEQAAKERNPWLERVEAAQRAAEEIGAKKAAQSLIEQATQMEVARAEKRHAAERQDNPVLANAAKDDAQAGLDAFTKQLEKDLGEAANAEPEAAGADDEDEGDEIPADTTPEPEIPRRGSAKQRRPVTA